MAQAPSLPQQYLFFWAAEGCCQPLGGGWELLVALIASSRGFWGALPLSFLARGKLLPCKHLDEAGNHLLPRLLPRPLPQLLQRGPPDPESCSVPLAALQLSSRTSVTQKCPHLQGFVRQISSSPLSRGQGDCRSWLEGPCSAHPLPVEMWGPLCVPQVGWDPGCDAPNTPNCDPLPCFWSRAATLTGSGFQLGALCKARSSKDGQVLTSGLLWLRSGLVSQGEPLAGLCRGRGG